MKPVSFDGWTLKESVNGAFLPNFCSIQLLAIVLEHLIVILCLFADAVVFNGTLRCRILLVIRFRLDIVA